MVRAVLASCFAVLVLRCGNLVFVCYEGGIFAFLRDQCGVP